MPDAPQKIPLSGFAHRLREQLLRYGQVVNGDLLHEALAQVLREAVPEEVLLTARHKAAGMERILAHLGSEAFKNDLGETITANLIDRYRKASHRSIVTLKAGSEMAEHEEVLHLDLIEEQIQMAQQSLAERHAIERAVDILAHLQEQNKLSSKARLTIWLNSMRAEVVQTAFRPDGHGPHLSKMSELILTLQDALSE